MWIASTSPSACCTSVIWFTRSQLFSFGTLADLMCKAQGQLLVGLEQNNSIVLPWRVWDWRFGGRTHLDMHKYQGLTVLSVCLRHMDDYERFRDLHSGNSDEGIRPQHYVAHNPGPANVDVVATLVANQECVSVVSWRPGYWLQAGQQQLAGAALVTAVQMSSS